MKEHIQVKKPYACSYCDKKFEENQNIKMHERIQKSKKPFEMFILWQNIWMRGYYEET